MEPWEQPPQGSLSSARTPLRVAALPSFHLPSPGEESPKLAFLDMFLFGFVLGATLSCSQGRLLVLCSGITPALGGPCGMPKIRSNYIQGKCFLCRAVAPCPFSSVSSSFLLPQDSRLPSL